MKIGGFDFSYTTSTLTKNVENNKDLFDLELKIEPNLTQNMINNAGNSDCQCSDSGQCSGCGCASTCSSC